MDDQRVEGAKDFDMDIARSTSHNSLQSHEDMKVRMGGEMKGIVPCRSVLSFKLLIN